MSFPSSLLGAGGGRGMRSFRQDASVTSRRLHRGTIRRVLTFARPYRRQLAAFLVLISVDAAAGAVTPLLFQRIIDDGITAGDVGLVVALSAVAAGLAVLSGALGVAQRWFSSRIGEGLIVDLRTAVFDHVQRMPLAFFSRTRTGALVQRLNGDVLGAQQAFTSTLSNVFSNLLTVVFVLAAMLSMSWQLTLLALTLLPAFVLPARWVGKRLAAITRESYELNAEAAQTMNERFNVAGAHLVKVFGDPDRESSRFAAQARRVRDIGVRQAMYGTVFRVGLTVVASVAVAIVYGLGGVMAISGSADRRHGRRAHRLPGPSLRPADGDVERPGRRHDGPRQLRARARGARPRAHRHGRPRRRRPRRGRRARGREPRARRRDLPLPERGRGLPRLARVRGRRGHRPDHRHPPRRLVLRARGRDGRARRVVRRGQDHRVAARDAHVRPERRARPDRRSRPARRHAGEPARRGRRGHAGGAPVPRLDRGEPARR